MALRNAALAIALVMNLGSTWAALASTQNSSEPSGSGLNAFCSRPAAANAEQNDRVLQFAAQVQRTLSMRSDAVALISRSGLPLERFGMWYSHSGVLIKRGESWVVRQLYFDCEVGRPRIFDQGLAGFLLSAEAPDLAHVSLVFLPPGPARSLEHAARDNVLAAELLAPRYSANAYPYSVRYQNCNQWLAELLAVAWGELPRGPGLRARAQDWLRQSGYEASAVALGSHLTRLLGPLVPLVHLDDHPLEDQFALNLQVSLPPALEAHARRLHPEAERIELCHTREEIVRRAGWQPMDASCTPTSGDDVAAFDS